MQTNKKEGCEKRDIYKVDRERGKWTKELVSDLEAWVNRKHENMNYYLSQTLTSHGCFGEYLHRIGKKGSTICFYCPSDDNAEHTIFYCRAVTAKKAINVL